MKNFGHKYDGAEEQEQMLNMLNIGLGAFLLYLFYKNFGKKMSGGDPTGLPAGDGDKKWWNKSNVVIFRFLTFLGVVFFLIVVIFQEDGMNVWPVLGCGLGGAVIFIFLSLNPIHQIFGDSKDVLWHANNAPVEFPFFLLLLSLFGSIVLSLRGSTFTGAITFVLTLFCSFAVWMNDDKLMDSG